MVINKRRVVLEKLTVAQMNNTFSASLWKQRLTTILSSAA
jgi:hypothetical protein